MSAPGLTLAQQLASALSVVLGTEVFNGPVRPDPARAIFCLTHGGRAPDDIVGGGAVSYKYPRVQIRVREQQESFGSGEALARNVHEAVHLIVPAAYIECRAVESAPLYLGQDDSGRHEWSMNFELTIRE